MSIKGVWNNIRNKGIKKTWSIHQYDKRMEQEAREWEKQIPEFERLKKEFRETIVLDEKLFKERPFLQLETELEYKAYMAVVFEKENEYRKRDKTAYEKKYYNKMRAEYIKRILPRRYNELKDRPVQENKVIFLESGNSPSPSSSYISIVMKGQRNGPWKFGGFKWDVHMTGLQVRKVSFLEYFENALHFIEDLSDAKAVFFSTANDLLSHLEVRPETKVIQLWHGVGVFKKVGYSTVDSAGFGRSAKLRQEYDQYRNYTYVTIPSMEQAWIFEDAMHIPVDSGKLVDVGVARTDQFFNEKYLTVSRRILDQKFPQTKGKKILLYVPTFRGTVSDAKAPDALDIDKLGEALADKGYILLIKHHGLSKNIPPIPKKWENTFAFDMNANKILSIERLLAIADICITDYSSVAFEFAIMERPLIFFAYDLEDYIDERGMYYNYDEITPGPVCKTNEEMIDYIVNIKERFDRKEIHDFREKYVGKCDGHSTERTIALVEK